MADQILNPFAAQAQNAAILAPNPMADPASPYFLHLGESPGLLLVSSVLTESNYHIWSRAMIVALDAKNKVGFIDGTLPQPVLNDPLRVIWDRNNEVILAWMVRALCFEIAQSVMFITKASDLWLELKLRLLRILILELQICKKSCTQ